MAQGAARLRTGSLLIAAISLALGLAMGTTAARSQGNPDSPLYLDSKQPIDVRVDDLMQRMTLEEKIGQLNLPCAYVDQLGGTSAEKMERARKFVAGTLTQEIGPGAGFFTLANELRLSDVPRQVDFFNELQKIALTDTRLKIPLLEDEEGTHGVMFPGGTVFPEGLAIGSTFDMPLVQRVYEAAAQEARASGIHVLSTLVLETNRDPRMGRNMEGYSEDPYLYSRIAEKIVRGAQGLDISARDKVVALMTDFPTQSQPASGMERGAVDVSERTIRQYFLPPWIAAFKAGALGVMAGYPEIDDVPEHSSEKWNTQILREELGFRGIVTSEGGGFDTLIYEHIVPNQKEAGAVALKAGVDMDITYEPAYMGPLVENVREGKVPEALVDRAVRRVLELKFRLGLFEHPYVDVNQARKIVHSDEHRHLASQVAREGIVLLKNDHMLLPLRKDLKSIAVIGPNADDVWNQVGDYSPSAIPQHVTTVLEGIRQKVTAKPHIQYIKGCEVIGGKSDIASAVAAARKADVAIIVVGEHPRSNAGVDEIRATDGEGADVAGLELTGDQEELVEAVAATGTPVVMVLVNGRPLSIPWEAEHIPAIIEAWEPGENGGEAVADVLFGDFNPSGRLAISVPRNAGQLPIYYNFMPSKEAWMENGGNHDGGYVNLPGTPLYPFGFGLSYTQFKYSNLRLSAEKIYQGGSVEVKVDVANVGVRAGAETVQMYVRERYTPVAVPVKQLRGFERVELAPGELKTVTLKLTPEELMLLDRDMHWIVFPGTFDIMIGKSSSDIELTGTLQVLGADPLVGQGLNR